MWASIVSLVKLLPGLVALLTYVKDQYEKYKLEKINKDAEKKKREIEKITSELNNAKTDEQRKALLKRLANINNL